MVTFFPRYSRCFFDFQRIVRSSLDFWTSIGETAAPVQPPIPGRVPFGSLLPASCRYGPLVESLAGPLHDPWRAAARTAGSPSSELAGGWALRAADFAGAARSTMPEERRHCQSSPHGGQRD